MPMPVSTSLNVLFDGTWKRTVGELLRRVNDAGFQYIDINFGDWSESPSSPFVCGTWENWVAQIKEFGSVNRVVYSQAHGPIYNILGDDERTAFLHKMSYRSVQAAGMLGIPWIVIHAGNFPGDFGTEHKKELLRRNYDWFAPFVEHCAKHNVGLVIENMSHTFGAHQKMSGFYCSELDDLLELVQCFDSQKVGVCWDTGHAHLHGADQPACIRTIGARLKALHIQDSDGKSDQHLAPYYGTIDWPPIIRAIYDTGYPGCFTFESHNTIRPVPDDCKDSALCLLYHIGQHLVSL